MGDHIGRREQWASDGGLGGDLTIQVSCTVMPKIRVELSHVIDKAPGSSDGRALSARILAGDFFSASFLLCWSLVLNKYSNVDRFPGMPRERKTPIY